MKDFEFEKTSIPSQFSVNLKDNFGMMWVDAKTSDLYRVLFTTIASALRFHQSKDASRIGMSIRDDKGNFKFGAVLNFKKPEEGSEEDSGNWYLEFTFNQEDMTDLDLEVDNHSDIFVRCAAQEASSICYGRFRSTDIMFNMFITCIDTLVDFLDANVVDETDEVQVTLHGIFVASAAVENGTKIMSIVPGEYIKQIIKNDSAL